MHFIWVIWLMSDLTIIFWPVYLQVSTKIILTSRTKKLYKYIYQFISFKMAAD